MNGSIILIVGLVIFFSTFWFYLHNMSKAQKAHLKSQKEELAKIEVVKKEAEDYEKFLRSSLIVDPIEIQLGDSLLALTMGDNNILERISTIRAQFAATFGVLLPLIRVRDNIFLSPNEYVIKIKDQIVGQFDLIPNHYLIMDPNPADNRDKLDGIKTYEPAFGLDATWIIADKYQRADELGYTVIDCGGVLATHLSELCKRNLSKIIGVQEVVTVLENAQRNYPVLVKEALDVIGAIKIKKIFGILLNEEISLRDITVVLETMLDTYKMTQDPQLIAECIKKELKKELNK